MKMPKTLTRAASKRITEDWQREIPSLGVYEPRWLLRRVGPLLEGICLDRRSGGDTYHPTFHVACLGQPAEFVPFTLATYLRSERSGGQDFVKVRWHEEKYKQAVERMVRQSPLPLEGDLHLHQVIDAYRAYLATPEARVGVLNYYSDMIILFAWARDSASARDVLAECLKLESKPHDIIHQVIQGGKVIKERVGFRVEDPVFGDVGGRGAFEAECLRLIENPIEIDKTIESQISVLGVGDLPVAELIV